jgi:hypothetical protein
LKLPEGKFIVDAALKDKFGQAEVQFRKALEQIAGVAKRIESSFLTLDLAPLDLALARIARAFPKPGDEVSDLWILYCATCGDVEPDEEKAMSRMVARMHPGIKNPKARRALKWLTEERNKTKKGSEKLTPRQYLTDLLLPAGIRIGLGRLHNREKTRIRLGKDWVKDVSGAVVEVDPNYLTLPDLARWILQEAHRNATATVLDHVSIKKQVVDGEIPQISASIEDLLTLAADEGQDIHSEETLRLTTRERHFIELRNRGLDEIEIACAMKIKPDSVKKLSYRLKEKIRKSPKLRSFRLP